MKKFPEETGRPVCNMKERIIPSRGKKKEKKKERKKKPQL